MLLTMLSPFNAGAGAGVYGRVVEAGGWEDRSTVSGPFDGTVSRPRQISITDCSNRVEKGE